MPNRFRALFCMEPDYQGQQDKWLLQERLRQIRRLEEDVARLKWRNYNLDAQLTQTFDLLDTNQDLEPAFSGKASTGLPPQPFRPIEKGRPSTSKELLDDMRQRRPSFQTEPVPRMSRKDQGSLSTKERPSKAPPPMNLPLVPSFLTPSPEAIASAGSRGSVPGGPKDASMRRAASQELPRSTDQKSSRVAPSAFAPRSVAKFDDPPTDKANLTHD